MMELIYIYEALPNDLEENGDSLIDWLDPPEITRSINQQFSFYGNYSIKGSNADFIKKGNWIKTLCPDETWQYFEIKTVTKNLYSVSVNAVHLGYLANRNFISESYIAYGDGSEIMNNLKKNLAFKQLFDYTSTITHKHQFTAKEVNPIDAIIGQNNGNQNLTGVVDGELDMDNYKLTLRDRIGEDEGFRIDLGINLESVTETMDDLSVVNSLYLIGGEPEDKQYDDDQLPVRYKYLEVKGVTDDNRRIGKRENSECKTEQELKNWGQSLYDKDRIHEPKISHEINMVSLEATMEYRELYSDLAKLQLGDTVYCTVDYMNLEIAERMIEYVWIPTLKKYKSVILGNDLGMFTNNVHTQLSEAKKELKKTASELTESMIQATELINGVQGGSVLQYPKNYPNTTYYMDTDSTDTAKNVIALNNAGIGFSTTGWHGPFRNAWTIDGKLNADFIKSGVLEGVDVISKNAKYRVKMSDGAVVFQDVDTGKLLGTLYGLDKIVNGQRQSELGIIQKNGCPFVVKGEENDGTVSTHLEVIPKGYAGNTSANSVIRLNAGQVQVSDVLYITGKLILNGKEITGNSGSGGATPPTLTTEQEKNAWFIWMYFKNKGWTEQSIAGMLGNMQSESGIVPDIDEYGGGGGYGIVQWTPKSKLVDWCNSRGIDYRTLDSQCARMQWEMENKVQWIATTSYPYSFQEFSKKTDVSECAWAFITNYERPLNVNQPIRATQAQYWYDKFINIGNYDWKNPVRSQYIVTQEWDSDDYWSGGVVGNHGGIDLASIPAGSKPPIYAARRGTVIARSVGTVEGTYVLIDHNDGYYTYYGHLDSSSVSQGQKVTNDIVIGIMGTTGASTGVHLHFEVRQGGSSANFRINPRDVINF